MKLSVLEWYSLTSMIWALGLALVANYASNRVIVYGTGGVMSAMNPENALLSNAEVTMLFFMALVSATQFYLLRTQSIKTVKKYAPLYFYMFTFFAVLQLSANSSIFEVIQNYTTNSVSVPIVRVLKGFELTLPVYLLQNLIMQILYYREV